MLNTWLTRCKLLECKCWVCIFSLWINSFLSFKAKVSFLRSTHPSTSASLWLEIPWAQQEDGDVSRHDRWGESISAHLSLISHRQRAVTWAEAAEVEAALSVSFALFMNKQRPVYGCACLSGRLHTHTETHTSAQKALCRLYWHN